MLSVLTFMSFNLGAVTTSFDVGLQFQQFESKNILKNFDEHKRQTFRSKTAICLVS